MLAHPDKESRAPELINNNHHFLLHFEVAAWVFLSNWN